MARFKRLRVFLSRPGRPQISPQQYWVTSSCSGRLKSSAVANALSTKSFPKTLRRMASPLSNTSLSTVLLLSNDKWVWCFARDIDPNAFRLQVFLDGVDTALTAHSRTFITAEWRHVAYRA